MSGSRGSFTSRVQSLGDSCTRTPSILPQSTILFSSVPAYGVTQFGLRSYPSGLFVPETSPTSFSFITPDRPVYATVSIRPSGPCQPTSAMAGPMFFLPQESRSARFRRTSRLALTWGIPRFRVPGPFQTASSTLIVWS